MIVYMLTSPSGKKYFGITGTSLKKRLDGHIRRAANGKRHPLYDAIRKYGIENFRVDVVSENIPQEKAKEAEIILILAFNTTDRAHGYNLSPGGDHDGGTGGKLFWGELNKDPKAREKYLAKLSLTKRSRDWSDYEKLSEAAKKWREKNPDLAKQLSEKASKAAKAKHLERVANGWTPKKAPPKNPGRSPREYVKEVWENRTEAEKARIAESVARSMRRVHRDKSPEERAAHNAQLAEARKSIDHAKRKARQKEALIAYWTPERKAAKAEAMRALRKAEREC